MAALIGFTPSGMRGTVVAFISVGNMLIGSRLGPFVVGLIFDAIGTEDSLRFALLFVSGGGYLLSTLCFLASGITQPEA